MLSRKFIKSTVIASVAIGIIGMNLPAQAQTLRREGPPATDPIIAWAQQMAPRDEFFINSNEDVELIRFKTDRDNTVCVPRNTRLKRLDGEPQNYALKVMWGKKNKAIIKPGKCLSFDAKTIKVRVDGRMPQDVTLVGSIRTSK